MAKQVVIVCQKCGHEYKVDFVDREEAAQRKIRTRSTPPSCPKCGSGDVKVYS